MPQPVTTTASRAPLPALRAVVFAVVGTVLGMSAHHLLAEGPVPWAQGAVAAGALFGLGLVGTRRPRSLATVVACSVVAQAGLHLWLTLTVHEGHAAATTMGHHGTDTGDTHAAWHERLHDSLAMTMAHTLVAVLVAVLLHRADATCWSLAHGGLSTALDAMRPRLTAVRTLLAGRSTAAMGLKVPFPAPQEPERPPPRGPVLAHALVRRGPPPTRPALVN
ncbi:hypothetical protein ACFPH6_22880 [Streptomyces xiangluensis]|uniref:MFS transporter n=1 Tax=Streptomyces xiangluensis TaxID=2665720 RepID=A0ABV8YQ06_9ACTN